jgi:hypothetical protein
LFRKQSFFCDFVGKKNLHLLPLHSFPSPTEENFATKEISGFHPRREHRNLKSACSATTKRNFAISPSELSVRREKFS